MIKGITPKIRMLCFVLINSVPLNLLCVWLMLSYDIVLCTLVRYICFGVLSVAVFCLRILLSVGVIVDLCIVL